MNREEAARMMTDLIRIHRLDQQGWTFAWMQRKRTLGLCKYGSRELLLSTYYVDRNDKGRVYETCLHEIAHALTPGAKHGPEWVRKAEELGIINPRPCSDADMPEGRWVAVHSCGKRYSKHRAPKTGPGRFYFCQPCWKSLAHLPRPDRIAGSQLTFADTATPVVVSTSQTPVRTPVSAAASSPAQTVAPTSTGAPTTFTAPQVAAAMKVDPKSFRAWLRRYAIGKSFQQGPGGAYLFSADDVRNIVAAWNQTH